MTGFQGNFYTVDTGRITKVQDCLCTRREEYSRSMQVSGTEFQKSVRNEGKVDLVQESPRRLGITQQSGFAYILFGLWEDVICGTYILSHVRSGICSSPSVQRPWNFKVRVVER